MCTQRGGRAEQVEGTGDEPSVEIHEGDEAMRETSGPQWPHMDSHSPATGLTTRVTAWPHSHIGRMHDLRTSEQKDSVHVLCPALSG